MLFYYLKLAYRNVVKHKLNSLLTIVGFGVALCLVILLSLYSYKELSTNHFHDEAKRIYKVSGWGTPNALAPFLEERIPEIESICRICGGPQLRQKLELNKDTQFEANGMIYTDNSFFDVFTFPVIAGNDENFLNDPYSIVLTQSLAKKLFGEEEALDREIKIGGQIHTVKGIMKDPPHNSSLQFELVVSLKTWEKQGSGSLKDNWHNFSYETFAKFRAPVDKMALQEKIQKTITQEGNLQYEVEHVKLYSLMDVYFNPSLYSQFGTGNKKNVYSMIWIGVIILVLAIVNFFNLATSQGIFRGQEIGVRKVNGGMRSSLIWQFMGESFILAFVSMIIALLLTNIAIPWFNQVAQTRFDYLYLQDIYQWLALIAGTLTLTLLAGSYPAFYLSSFKPVEVIKSVKLKTKGVTIFRQVLIIFQFTASIILIVATLFISRQLNFLKTKDLGFEKESIMCIQLNMGLYNNYNTFISRLNQNPAISAISNTSGYIGTIDSGFRLETLYYGEEKEIWCKQIYADTAFLRTFDIEMIEQRQFNKANPFILLNERAIKQLNVESPFGIEVKHGEDYHQIAGVVKDFHFKSLKHGIEPLTIFVRPVMWGLVNIRFNPKSYNSVAELVAFCRNLSEELAPNETFKYDFLDDVLARSYASESRFQLLISIFSVFAIFISCLGLFGMIVFSNARRTKEIGVRKVMGAKITTVLTLLIRDYTKWIILSFVIATPISFYLIMQWLSTFPFRTNLTWWVFALAGGITLSVALITVCIQSWRTAARNPVEALRYE
ncbi:FtsX-like permease family protein [Puteibacter caeruleilacunae]|nr:FtsX-like permease family protein [Puteibacter caeruleilacunae]